MFFGERTYKQLKAVIGYVVLITISKKVLYFDHSYPNLGSGKKCLRFYDNGILLYYAKYIFNKRQIYWVSITYEC